LLVEWNDTKAEFPRDRCLHELFEEQAARRPQAAAVTFEDRQLTYGELNSRANQLAHHLRALGVRPDTLVGICVERSLEMVVGLLGILKAGGAYVPLDPEYPQERLAYMLADTAAPVLLTQARLKERLPQHRARSVCLEEDWAAIAQQPLVNPANCAQPQNLAYCIYTSGSTGRPKGVGLLHANAVGFLKWTHHAFSRQQTARVLFSTSICFDLSVFELFTPLTRGDAVLLVRDPLALAEAKFSDAPTLINTVPSALGALLDAGVLPSSAQTINVAGEALQRSLADRLYAALPGAQLYNLYGPSEYTTYSTYCRVERDPASIVTIGRPISNTQIYILDERLNPVQVGMPGEIHIAGAGLARGYLNRPDLTAEKFIPNPFGKPGSRMYQTGDLGRYLPDGNIVFLGRIDHQVKIRGFRIELGEIESTLLRCEGVRAAVVLAREDVPGDKRLVAYVVPKEQAIITAGDLRAQLRKILPDYMLPAAFVFLRALPVNANGKIDRKALPAPEVSRNDADRAALPPPDFERGHRSAFVAPRTGRELKVAQMWRDMLGVERVGVADNFFDLGGDSLMLVRLIGEMKRREQVSLGVVELFRHPTVAQMARLIDQQPPKGKRQPAVVPLQEGGSALPVYFIYAGPDEFRLAKLMGERHAVFGIDAPWPLAWRNAVAANRRSGFPTMEQLVAPYVAALSAHARASPCVLAGHSFAGLMAFEAAHQFLRQGGKVEMVMLLDTWATPPIPHRVAWYQWLQNWKQAPKGSRLRSSWRITRWLLGQEKYRVWLFFEGLRLNPELTAVLDEEGMPLPGGMLGRVYRRIGDSYRPRRLDSRGVLFRTDELNGNAILRDDDSLGWNSLFARGLEIIPMIGDHISMIRSHHPTLAREMNEVLKRHWPA
jgi:amino acid adenylation domain-containing protein